MRQNIPSFIKLSINLFLVLWILSACSGGNVKVRYYLIDPIESTTLSYTTDKSLVIEIMGVQLPQYLERFQIATRSSDNRLRFSDTNQWGENLRKNLLRTMARNLSIRLSTLDIATPLNRSASLPDYRILIHIDQFELDTDGKVKLSTRWQLTDGTEAKPLGIHSASLASETPIEADNYDQIIAAMQDLYSQLSTRIADTIIAEESRQIGFNK